jgi:DNA-binding PadR family transcriptional regulator
VSEARLLALVEAHPHRSALARRTRDGSLFPALRRLEDRGLVFRRRDLYRLTRSGAHELETTRALVRLAARAA